MSGWTLAKYLLVFSGLGIVLLSDRFGMPRLGYAGLALVVAAFFVRFAQRRKATQRKDSPPSP
ncbi:MAG: hypothetical protein Q7J79_10890 [Gemmatimonadales bacterium]|nr:hypothetical protein [Gemmatimonadales bacterium]